jgi:integrase
MRLRVPKPARSFLEMDELVALTDAAAEQDTELIRPLRSKPQPGTTAGHVAERLGAGMRPAEIAADLGLAKSTVSYHARRLGIEGRREYVGRRAVVATLGGAGLRASELCDVRLRDVRLHDPSGARARIPDAKTEAGIREVQLSPDLVDELVAHIDRLRRAGLPTGPDAYLFPNLRGGLCGVGFGSGGRPRSTNRSVARSSPLGPGLGLEPLKRTSTACIEGGPGLRSRFRGSARFAPPHGCLCRPGWVAWAMRGELGGL